MSTKFKKKIRTLLTIGAILSIFATSSNADQIRWNLNQFNFQDSGKATGYFDWDTVAQTSSNYEIIVTEGDTATFPIFTYSDESTNFAAALNTLFFFDSSTPLRVLRIGLASISALDTPVAVLPPLGNSFTGSVGFVECYNCTIARFGASSSGAFLSAVPEPITLGMLGLGMLGMGVTKKRIKPH